MSEANDFDFQAIDLYSYKYWFSYNIGKLIDCIEILRLASSADVLHAFNTLLFFINYILSRDIRGAFLLFKYCMFLPLVSPTSSINMLRCFIVASCFHLVLGVIIWRRDMFAEPVVPIDVTLFTVFSLK